MKTIGNDFSNNKEIGNSTHRSIVPELKAGDITGGNYVELNETQGTRYRGTSTVWKDMIMDLFGRQLASTAGAVDYDLMKMR